ncbi:hypothetical protein [Humibacter soli]
MAVAVGTLAGCIFHTNPAGVPSGERTGAAQQQSASQQATIRGSIVQYGGPLGANGSPPPPRPVAAVAVLYNRADDATAPEGEAVARFRTTASSNGTFSIPVSAGDYVIDAESLDGSPLTDPKPITVRAGQTRTITLSVSVP